MKFAVFLLVVSFFQPLSTSAQEIDSNLSSYPSFILSLMNYIPRWSPNELATPACLESLSLKTLDPKACRAANKLFPLTSLRSKLFFDFPLDSKGGFNKIDFQIAPGLKIRGLLGLHEKKNRPLIIFRMGIHGNRDEYIAERFLVKILFKDLGYHVLTLESLTSHGFISSNDQFSFGGVEEGLHTLFVLNQIRKKEFEWVNQISSIHLVALSMGGAGAFLTTYLDELTFQQIKSVQMFCPLVNLQENFERLSEPGFLNAFADYWNSMRLRALNDKIPTLSELSLWEMLIDFKPRFAPSVLGWISSHPGGPVLKVDHLEKRFLDLKLPSAFKNHVEKSKTFYELNNFWPFFKNKKTPIQLVTTRHDLLVLNEVNVDRIRNGTQPGQFDKTSFVDLEGFHCSLAEEYEWPFLVETIRRGIE